MSSEVDRYIEIYYDIASIPGKFEHPLDFRNAAMELIESALLDQQAGEWSGAGIGMGEVNFGFEVHDFDQAERIVRSVVEGTDFEGIREITRFEIDEQQMAAAAEGAPKVNPFWFLLKLFVKGLFRRRSA